jgi:hypothetical protein
MSGKLEVHKVTLETGKTVYLRELKIKHQELAAKAAAHKANGDNNLLYILLPKELMKLLICGIDEKEVRPMQLEQLDDLFTFREYAQLNKYLTKMSGTDSPLEECQSELVSFGGN